MVHEVALRFRVFVLLTFFLKRLVGSHHLQHFPCAFAAMGAFLARRYTCLLPTSPLLIVVVGSSLRTTRAKKRRFNKHVPVKCPFSRVTVGGKMLSRCLIVICSWTFKLRVKYRLLDLLLCFYSKFLDDPCRFSKHVSPKRKISTLGCEWAWKWPVGRATNENWSNFTI